MTVRNSGLLSSTLLMKSIRFWYFCVRHTCEVYPRSFLSSFCLQLLWYNIQVRRADILIIYLRNSYSPGVDSAFNRNEYGRPYHSLVPLSWNLGVLTSLTSWNLPVTGLLCLLCIKLMSWEVMIIMWWTCKSRNLWNRRVDFMYYSKYKDQFNGFIRNSLFQIRFPRDEQ